jgi:putative membrane protein
MRWKLKEGSDTDLNSLINSQRHKSFQRSHILLSAAIALVALLVLSGIRPFDRTTWFLEVFPVMVALPVLWATYRRFPLTGLLYILIFIHALVLMLGGAYSYARVPLGFYLVDLLDLNRNPYDKIGHFFQGFVPALLAREILLRGQFVRGAKMLAWLIICIVLAISAVYELIEWAAALILGQGADEFLGTQGYQWDTQSDMFLALIGGCVALLALSRIHDRQLKGLCETEFVMPRDANTSGEKGATGKRK